MVQPFHSADRKTCKAKNMDEPLHTATGLTGGGLYTVLPLVHPLVETNGTQETARETEDTPSASQDSDTHWLIKPVLIEYYGDIRTHDPDTPLSTITQRTKHALIRPVLLDVNHRSKAQAPEDNRVHSMDEPLPSLTTKRGLGLAHPSIIEVAHGNGNEGGKGNNRRAHSVDEPLSAITTNPGLALAQPVLVQTGGNGKHTLPTGQPIPTVTTKNDKNPVSPTAFLVPNFGEAENQQPRVHDMEDPVPTVTSRGAGNLVTLLLEHLQEARIDPRRLVFIDGQPCLLDIRFRMLQNSELAKAMGFDDEETKYEFHGTVAEVTRQIGNTVPVHLATAFVKSILGQKALSEKTMA